MSIENTPVRFVNTLNEVVPGAEGVRSNVISASETGSCVAASTTRPDSRTMEDAWNGAATNNESTRWLTMTAIIGGPLADCLRRCPGQRLRLACRIHLCS